MKTSILTTTAAAMLCCIVSAEAGETAPVTNAQWTKTQSWKIKKNGAISVNVQRMVFTRVVRKTPAQSFTFSIYVTPVKTNGRGWKTIGVMAFTNYKNYWAFNLTEMPKKKGSKHVLELRAMVNGKWGFNKGKYASKTLKNMGFNWKLGEKYKMTISINAKEVTGILSDASGKEISKSVYIFKAKDFWKGGTPGLRAANFAANLTDAKLTVQDKE